MLDRPSKLSLIAMLMPFWAVIAIKESLKFETIGDQTSCYSSDGDVHEGTVLMKAQFDYEEEIGLRCEPSPSQICVQESGSMPSTLIPLSSYLSYSEGAQVHLWLNSGSWNSEAWGESVNDINFICRQHKVFTLCIDNLTSANSITRF